MWKLWLRHLSPHWSPGLIRFIWMFSLMYPFFQATPTSSICVLQTVHSVKRVHKWYQKSLTAQFWTLLARDLKNFLSLILPMSALMWAPASPSFHGSSLCYLTVIGHWEYQEAEANGSQEEFQTVLATHTAAYTIPLHLETKEGLEQWFSGWEHWVLPEDLGSIPSTHMAAHTSLHGNFGWWGTADQPRSLQAMQVLYCQATRDCSLLMSSSAGSPKVSALQILRYRLCW